ncbi:hypothetical protein SAMN04488541_100996 [Thermoflexibacter ruber]|uniref:Uncharacterized protein n=1 Tax=Thermoflexibacter ruber TaxID=1003 RepID=A0A1I2ECY4_9BACT|nr:hypothetical protein SAMN04488541_100996 [Thermoflexibacter ruber]
MNLSKSHKVYKKTLTYSSTVVWKIGTTVKEWFFLEYQLNPF